jgi:HSP20 family molecular chaperone IbpA
MTTQLARTTGTGRTLFGDLLGFDPFRMMPAAPSTGWTFEINKVENGYKLELPVPGFKPEEIEVTIEDRVLTIVGKSEKRQFTRTLVLPEEVDEANVEAAVEHGMLTLELHLHPKAQPRRIPVKLAGATANN